MKTIIAGIIFSGMFCLFCGTAFAETLFIEDWEAGIDPLKWETAGDPLPVIFSSGHSGKNALDINGDEVCNSAVCTVQKFDTTCDLVADFWLRGNSSGMTGMTITAGFTTGDLPAIPCEHEGYYKTFVCIQMISSSLGKGIIYTVDDEFVREDYFEGYPDDEWHNFRIEIKPDGIISFYRDDTLRYTTSTRIDLSYYPLTRFQAEGKATFKEYPMLIDDITLSTQGVSCVPDYNRDGNVDITDLTIRAEDEINRFKSWMLLCWKPMRDCGDYNNDGIVGEIDIIAKTVHMLNDFFSWCYQCWLPAVISPTGETIKQAFEIMGSLKKEIEREAGL